MPKRAPWKGNWIRSSEIEKTEYSVKPKAAVCMGADSRLLVLYDYENGRICQFSLHRSRTSCPFRTVCPEQECRGAGRQWRPQKAAGILKHRPSRQARPQPFEGSQGGTPCPVGYDALRHILLGIIWRKTSADPAASLLRSPTPRSRNGGMSI